MSSFLPFIVSGLVTGSLYGLAATGLVLTYKTSGIFNFAHGAVGAAAAFAFFDIRETFGVPWPLALLVTLGLLAPGLGLLLATVARRLTHASTVRRVVATVGVLLIIQGLIQLRFGVVPISAEPWLPSGSVSVFGTLVGYDQIISMLVAVAALVGLGLLFTRTRLGLEMRGVVDNGELIDLAGGNPRLVQAASWVIGSSFAAVSGVLFAPTVGLDSVLLTLLVVQAFGAAAIGRFGNLPATFLGGLGIGVVQFLLRTPDLLDALPFLDIGGLDDSVSFLALFLVLLLVPRGTFKEPAILRPPRRNTRSKMPVLLSIAGVATVVLIALPHLFPAKAPVFIQGAVFTLVFASLYLLVEVSGQVSLCHVTFVAIGATTFTHFTTGAGLPWLVGVVGAAVVAVPVGAVVAVPATRLSGIFLALATLGFGILVQQMVYSTGLMFGTLGQRHGSRPDALGLAGDAGYFYLCTAVAAAAIATVLIVRKARLGRLLDALADSPTALMTHGSSVNVTRMLVFCLSASMAAVSGALLVGVVGSVSSAGVTPAALLPFNSLLWLAALAFVGRNPIFAPIAAAVALVVAPSYSANPNLAQYQTIVFGLLALVAAVYRNDAMKWLDEQGQRLMQRPTSSPVRARMDEGVVHA